MDTTKNAARNIFWGLINRFILIITPFINRTVMIYTLGLEYLGLDSLFASILQMLNIAELGFSSAIIFSMYKPIAENNHTKICALLGLYRKVYRIIGLIILAIGIAIIPVLTRLIKGDIPENVNIYILYMIFLINTVIGYWLYSYKNALITAHQRVDILSNINSVVKFLGLGLQIVILLVFKNYYYYILIMPLLTVLENLSVEYIARKKYSIYYCAGELDQDTKSDIWKRIKGLMIQKVCAKSRNSMDNIIISAFLGLTLVTIYGNYYYIMAGLQAILNCFTTAIVAGVGHSIAVDSAEKNHEDMLMFDFMYMWLSGVIASMLFCIYQPIIVLWVGERSLLPFRVMCAFCVYFYALCMGDIRALYATGAGLWWEGRYRSLTESIVNIVLNIVLGKFWGLFGIVTATIISIIMINFLYGSTIVYRFYYKNGKVMTYYKKHLLYGSACLISSTVAYWLCQTVRSETVLGIISRCMISFLVCNIIFWIVYRKQNEYRQTVIFVKQLISNWKYVKS